jgi:hypothetical protein
MLCDVMQYWIIHLFVVSYLAAYVGYIYAFVIQERVYNLRIYLVIQFFHLFTLFIVYQKKNTDVLAVSKLSRLVKEYQAYHTHHTIHPILRPTAGDPFSKTTSTHR